jgi:hypothetical protein
MAVPAKSAPLPEARFAMTPRALVATLALAAAAGCSGGSGGASVLGSESPQGGGAVTQPILFTGAVNDNLSASDPNYLQKTIVFGQLNITISTKASEDYYTGKFTLTPTATAGCPTPSNVFTITTSDNLTFAIKSKAVGICEIIAADSENHSEPLWVSVSTAGGVGQ